MTRSVTTLLLIAVAVAVGGCQASRAKPEIVWPDSPEVGWLAADMAPLAELPNRPETGAEQPPAPRNAERRPEAPPPAAAEPGVTRPPATGSAELVQVAYRQPPGSPPLPPPANSGAPDSGTPNDGAPDSGAPNSGTPDSGAPDSGAPDSGAPDSGAPDSGQDPPEIGGLEAVPLGSIEPWRPGPEAIPLRDVVASVHASYPLLEAAFLESAVANGKQLATWGAFDTKLKASSENGPVGFYETFRHSAGFLDPLYNGSEVFGGYRVGRGQFQPWYLERQTNAGGEFKAGFNMPLLRNRRIDKRRADLWRATYEQQRVQPEIRMFLIQFVRDASVVYWGWVAAHRQYEIGRRALDLANRRNSQLKRRVEEGDLDPPVLQDNLRAIAQREAKVLDRGRKLQQSAFKLSLFYRNEQGVPLVVGEPQQADFPAPDEFDIAQREADIQAALRQRPELAMLAAQQRQVSVDLAEARNDQLPLVDAQLQTSQDMGAPTSSKRDKSPFELEAGVFMEMPLQRRKGRGKAQAARAKLQQLAAKQRFTQDKIVAEVQSAYAALIAAYQRVGKARRARELAVYMVDVEGRTFELGGSDLLALVLREQFAIEAADGEVSALFEYFAARADYAAALARDWPDIDN